MLNIICYTYRNDAILLPGLVRNVASAFPGSRLTLAVDDNNPLDKADESALEALASDLGYRVDIERTTFPRKGNLNGPSCVLGMLDFALAAASPRDLILKIDADAFIVAPEPIRGILSDPKLGYLAAQVANYPFGGYFYAVRADVLARVREWITDPSLILDGQHEDITIGCLAFMVASSLNLRAGFLYDTRAGGKTGAFSYSAFQEDPDAYLRRLVDDKAAILMTLGNPGVSREDSLRAQQALQAACNSVALPETVGTC